MKILVIQTAFIGDVILATPIVEKLRRHFPNATLDFLLRRGNEKLLAGHPHIRHTFVWDKKAGKIRDGLRILRLLRRERYDLVVNCQRFLTSGLFTVFAGAKTSVGFDKNPLSWLFSRRVAHRFGTAAQPIHEVERNLKLIENLTDGSFERPKLHPSAADFAKAERLKSEIVRRDSFGGNWKFVTLAPTSVWFTKQWPAHKWAELIRTFPTDCGVFLLGGPPDFEACEAIRTAAGRGENLAGKLTFLESAALMAGAAMNYVNDSAPMHMASAMNAPVTAIFCSTVPAFGFGPLSDKSFVVETSENLACRPCGLHGYRACPKGHFRCAEGIGVEQFGKF
ncbi:MAG: glycosyltransferase family 9 protein [Saprospiraceae bacterium]